MKRYTAIYARVSTEDQNCDRQIGDLRNYAEKADFEVVGVFKESASGAKNDRSERQKVMVLAQKRLIDVVLVTELTRWGRSTLDLITTLEELASWNVSVLAVDGFQFDLSTPQGRLMATVISAIAEFERGMIRERIKSGMAAAKAKGKQFGRKKGYCPSMKKMGKVMELKEQGFNISKIAIMAGVSRPTVNKLIKMANEMNDDDEIVENVGNI